MPLLLIRQISCKRLFFLSLFSFLSVGMIGGSEFAAAQQKTASGDQAVIADLRKRIQLLEEQMVDIQVVLGTLQTLAQGQPAQPSTDPASRHGGFQTNGASIARPRDAQQTTRTPQSDNQGGWQGDWSNNSVASDDIVGGFGETTVRPSNQSGNGMGQFIQQNLPGMEGSEGQGYGIQTDFSDPQSQYESAYGLLLQRNYGAAQIAFDEFIANNPQNALAGNAQYWLGETYYLQGEYKNAAGAYLKGYQTYSSNPKAPDSLLKLAMSLDRLNQRPQACASLKEMRNKYPTAPQHLLLRASQEIRRLRC